MHVRRGFVLGALISFSVVACGGDGAAPAEEGAAGQGGSGQGGAGGAGGAGGDGGAPQERPCPDGFTCVTSFPFRDARDTSVEGTSLVDSYACKPAADESGPEILYRVTAPVAGFLSAVVMDGAGVDIDVHLLASLKDGGCLDRGDVQARADIEAGDAWVVADTYVSGSGPQAGAYSIDIGFVPVSRGACDLVAGAMPRVGDGGSPVTLPSTGPLKRLGHLVTQKEPPPFPTSPTEELLAHYDLSQSTTGLVLAREEPWAPLEGASYYGKGSADPADVPALDEAYYVSMAWTAEARPPRGTRMILRDPAGGPRAVVVAAGYETGPADLSVLAGAPEEVHFYLGSADLDPMTLGIAADQSLPLGPRACE